MPENQILYREATPQDTTTHSSIDSCFTTNTIYTLTPAPPGSLGFTLTPTPISPPLTKHFPDDSDSDSDSDTTTGNYNYTLLASTPTQTIVDFISTTYTPWNKRLIIASIELLPTHRGWGIGRKLMDLAERHARDEVGLDVRYLWLKVSNVNGPAIGSYSRMGFEVCGVDVSLYEGTKSRREVGVFMWRVGGMREPRTGR